MLRRTRIGEEGRVSGRDIVLRARKGEVVCRLRVATGTTARGRVRKVRSMVGGLKKKFVVQGGRREEDGIALRHNWFCGRRSGPVRLVVMVSAAKF